MSRPPRFAVLLVALACAVLVAGCGNKEATVTNASTEGPYLDQDGLKYQVQISRYLNPADIEDKSYLVGLPQGTPEPGGDEVYFAVFMRVTNNTDKTLTPANDFEIKDTQGNVYRPIPLDPKVNPFAYESAPIAPGSMLPQPDSIASEGVIKQGALVLFKIKTDSLQNRPLVLSFRKGSGQVDTVNLDV